MAIYFDKKATNITWLNIEEKTLPYKEPDNISKISANLQFLNDRLNLATFKLDYWDIYKFQYSLIDKEQFDVVWAKLLPNTSMIINTTNSFDHKNVTYNPGDVLVKTDKGERVHIRNKQSGIFYPQKFTYDNGNGKITYGYARNFNEIINNSLNSGITWAEVNGKLQGKINFSEAGLNTTQSYCLIRTPNNGQITFPKAIFEGQLLTPSIKFYTDENEEIYYNLHITTAGNNITVSNIPSIVTKVVVK